MPREVKSDRYLAEVPLLVRLESDDRVTLGDHAVPRRFPIGAEIVREGEPGDSMHIVTKGRIRIVVTNGNGEQTQVATLYPGEILGEMALFDGLPRSASAFAVTETRTMQLTREAFVSWLDRRPHAAMAIMATLSQRLRRTNQTIVEIQTLDLEHRIAKQLLKLAAMHDLESAGETGLLKLEVTQQELADAVGVSRESVNKQLGIFAKEGWIRVSRGAITIVERGELRRYE
ncbi:MAG: Crp/Fnr family transcriptional regulator [Dehalococcoidia bacterium]